MKKVYKRYKQYETTAKKDVVLCKLHPEMKFLECIQQLEMVRVEWDPSVSTDRTIEIQTESDAITIIYGKNPLNYKEIKTYIERHLAQGRKLYCIVLLQRECQQDHEIANEIESFILQLCLDGEKIDFKFTNTVRESETYLRDVLLACQNQSKLATTNQYDEKSTKSHSLVSKLTGGVTNQYSLTFIDMLMCIPGVSERKAIAIVKMYPTLQVLIEHAHTHGSSSLADLEVEGKANRPSQKIGAALSKRIIECFLQENGSTKVCCPNT